MLHHEFVARVLVEDRHRELRHRSGSHLRSERARRRWVRPGRR
jgi:hypothetical protein